MSSTNTETTRYSGRVKWFNNRSGYGFITITDGDRSGDDVFVHHSGIQVTSEQYKYLVQGEYVTFDYTSTTSDVHPYQATNVRGMNEGQLMCETRNQQRSTRSNNTATSGEGGSTSTHSRQRRPRRQRQQGQDWVRIPRSALTDEQRASFNL